MERFRHPDLAHLRASEVLARFKPRFLEAAQVLKEQGILEDVMVFGSVARGDDTRKSDIDFLVKVKEARTAVQTWVQEDLAEIIPYPVHILVYDDERDVFPLILKDAIPLREWRREKS